MKSSLACAFLLFASGASAGTYVGQSSATVNGGVGFKGMQDACTADYGTQARICTSAEVMNTAPFPAISGSSVAWIAVTWPPLVVPQPNAQPFVIDQSGVSFSQPTSILNCSGFSTALSAQGDGLTVDQDGHFNRAGCGNSLHVACCIGSP